MYSSCSIQMCSSTEFTTPIGKQMKDNYPKKLTDCQKQTKNPHLYFFWGGGTKQKQKQNKSSTVSRLRLETEAVNP